VKWCWNLGCREAAGGREGGEEACYAVWVMWQILIRGGRQ
jgi:hypothetical protein